MDALLRFRSAELEARFWASAPVRATLLSADRAALPTVILNNALASYLFVAVGLEAELHLHYRWAAFFVTAQLLSTWCIHRHEGAYYEHRNAVIAFHRLTRIAGFIPYAAARNSSLLSGGAGAGGGMRELLKTLAIRGGMAYPWIYVLNFPAPFPFQALYTVLLALAQAVFCVWPGTGILLPGLAARPDLRAAACRLHRGLQMLVLVPRSFAASYTAANDDGGSAGGAADECPPSAPARIVLWVQLVGLLAPLAAAYMIELRAKGAFLRARGLRPPIAAHDVALGMAAVLVGVAHVAWLAGPRLA